MTIESGDVASSETVSDAGEFVRRAGDAAQTSKSVLGRAGATMAAVRLGARLIPPARRLIARNPVIGTLIVTATLGAVLWALTSRARSPLEPRH